MSDINGKSIRRLAQTATGLAQRRIRDAHPEEYQKFLEEEREKLGLPPMNAGALATENALLRRRIADLEAQL